MDAITSDVRLDLLTDGLEPVEREVATDVVVQLHSIDAPSPLDDLQRHHDLLVRELPAVDHSIKERDDRAMVVQEVASSRLVVGMPFEQRSRPIPARPNPDRDDHRDDLR